MKKLSVIVPVFNAEKNLHQCLESILAQSFKEYEVIIVDDGSTDRSADICDSFAERDERIRVFHRKNQGVSASRNFGLSVAKGRYIQFVDSDDWLGPDFVKAMVDTAQMHQLDLVISGYQCVSGNESVEKMPMPFIGDIKDMKPNFQELYTGYFLNAVWNKLFLREKIIQEFPEHMSLGEDCLFVFHYLKNAGRIAVINISEYMYRINTEDSLTKKIRKDALSIAWHLYKEVCNTIKYLWDDEKLYSYAGYVYMIDVRKFMLDLIGREGVPVKKKIACFKHIGMDKRAKEAIMNACGLSYMQKLVFSLLFKGHPYISYLLLKINH